MTLGLCIAFCGASGTGKSTLAARLALQLSLPLKPSFSRDVAAELGLGSPYDIDRKGAAAREMFQRRVFERSLKWELEHSTGGFVADRSLLDVATYTALHCDAREDVRFQQQVAQTTAHMYAALVLCPIHAFHNLGEDAARSSDLMYHRRYEQGLREQLDASLADWVAAPGPPAREQWSLDLGVFVRAGGRFHTGERGSCPPLASTLCTTRYFAEYPGGRRVSVTLEDALRYRRQWTDEKVQLVTVTSHQQRFPVLGKLET